MPNFHPKLRQLIKVLNLSDELIQLIAAKASVNIETVDREIEAKLYFAIKDFALETKVIRTYCQEQQEWLDEIKTDWSSDKFFKKRLTDCSDAEIEELEEFFRKDEESRKAFYPKKSG